MMVIFLGDCGPKVCEIFHLPRLSKVPLVFLKKKPMIVEIHKMSRISHQMLQQWHFQWGKWIVEYGIFWLGPYFLLVVGYRGPKVLVFESCQTKRWIRRWSKGTRQWKQHLVLCCHSMEINDSSSPPPYILHRTLYVFAKFACLLAYLALSSYHPAHQLLHILFARLVA